MEENNKKKRRQKPVRQEWKPNFILRLLHKLWMLSFGAVKIALGALATVACICIICLFVFVELLGVYLEDDVIPNANFALDNFELDQTSFLYYVESDGSIQQLQRVYTQTNRQWATYAELPGHLIDAAVAIEDKRFFEHQGVDWVTTIKACAGMFMGGGGAGGSTITQQLIKNLTQENSVTVQRKVMEWFRAAAFEKHYDKEVILEWYLNTIYLGDGCYGVKSAAANYFGKEIQMLTPAESAALVSITNNPSLFGPYSSTFEYDGREMTGAERNRLRQETVLWQMNTQGMLDDAQYEAALAQEMIFKSGIADDDRYVTCPAEDCVYGGVKATYELGDDGNYYCPLCSSQVSMETDASQAVYSWFVEVVLDDVAYDLAMKDGMTEWNDDVKEIYMELIRRSGYHIYTTLDMEVQNQVDLIYQNVDEVPDTKSSQQLQSAITVVDIRTGDIVAIAGGVGDQKGFDDYNCATDASLQTGSSLKPLAIYAPAFEMEAITPATVVKDLPLNYDDGAFPLNDNRRFNYARTVFSGVKSSVNAIAVNTLDMIGLSASYNFAKEKFRLNGLTDYYIRSDGFEMSDIDYAPLGMGALTEGVTVRDMSSAFATFASNGLWREGRTYTKVYDSEGNLILSNEQDSEQILNEKTINYMNYCLVNAVSSGTGGSAWFSGMEIAGKTGTTSSNRDRWFCGYTGYYAAAVWCGYLWPEQIYLYESLNPAAVMWRKVMEPLHEGKQSIRLYDRSVMSSVTVCLDSGLLATDACKLDVRTEDLPRTDSAMVYWEDRPEDSCTRHVKVEFCVTGGGVATEFCKKFAEVEEAEIEERALVKMTMKEIEELMKAKPYRLDENYLRDDYIYLVDEDGNDVNFRGFNNDANKGVNAPYITCTAHTQATWDEYLAANPPVDPSDPTDPSEPTEPGFRWPWE